ncbi:MAG: hydrogenase iron-sulfur subunit [Firmicutes bacterium]|nr:hydrogenase iron-sulfur subunit [Bacillota bacterium]
MNGKRASTGGTRPEVQEPRILVFSTNNISDPGIDLAGSLHLHYPPTVLVISVPCTSSIKPGWILHALEQGFDGVFIAADGEECAYLPDCTERSADIFRRAQELISAHGLEPQRLKMAALCSVCAEPFVNYVREFSESLAKLGSARKAG